jgi:hypothetical protein
MYGGTILRRRARSSTAAAAMIVLVVALAASGAAAAAASPTVTPPPAVGTIQPPNLNGFDLGQVGYEQSEHFLSGMANAYTSSAPLTNDGAWSVTPSSQAPYTTRVVVYRPINPKRFNGTVVVEWLNVSGQVDANPEWTMTHNELIRDGFVWVGVSAQAVGLNATKSADPQRYASLVHPGDSYSYDIFSQAGQAIRDNSATILGGLKPTTLLAAGESQSAGRMVTYIDAVHPLVHVYDGFLVHSRGARPAALSQAPQPSVLAPSPTLIRTDITEPVFVFQTESDVAGGFTARQSDSDTFRQWEAAGTSHFDTYGLTIGPSDVGDGQGAVANLAAMQNPTNVPGPGGLCTLAINTGGAHWLLDAAIYWLNQWVTNGTAPPRGQPLQTVTTSPFVYAKDANGNALGGVRSPQVDAPIATLAGIGNTPANGSAISQFCGLFGSTVPFTPDHLAALYKNHGQFVSAWGQATQNLVKDGFLLKPDANELTQSAVHSKVGK